MRRPIILIGDTQRAYAKQCIDEADKGDVVRISKPTRSSQQNDLMWSLISDIMKHPSNERPHWSEEAWKAGFMQYCGHEIQWDRGLGQCGPLPVGFRSSVLTVKEMNALITCIYQDGAENGITFKDPAATEQAARAA